MREAQKVTVIFNNISNTESGLFCYGLQNLTFYKNRTDLLTKIWGSTCKYRVIEYREKEKNIPKLRHEQFKLCFASLFMAWKRKSLVIASWNTELTAWSWGSRSLCDAISCLHACQAPFDPTDRRWTPYSNFRHRCDLPICFFSVLILPPDKIPHTRYLSPPSPRPPM